ncbi:MAG TPA: hypothetical protein VFG83_01865 [Kofleriaceae bacterium]|nr:hypothetical protein [Kofleriaceae bacterium]
MRTFILTATLLLGACAGPQIPPPTAVQVTRAQARWPEVTGQSLAHGRNLYVSRCSGCHLLHAPSEHTADEWPVLVGKMAPRAHLDATERTLILRYLIAVAPP